MRYDQTLKLRLSAKGTLLVNIKTKVGPFSMSAQVPEADVWRAWLGIPVQVVKVGIRMEARQAVSTVVMQSSFYTLTLDDLPTLNCPNF